jgi:hypothetical protein
MKKNLLALGAAVLAIALSSFSMKKTVNVFFVYGGSGNEAMRSSYTQQFMPPATLLGTDILNWFKIADDNGIVTDPEFTVAFSNYDTNHDGTLDDQTDIAGSLDRKAL